ncbi:c-type cytochrome [Halomonas denitrificans]|nr:c-type cytochrome [Halomonas denitrificans]
MAAAETASAGAAPQVAFDGSLDGAMIYDRVCAACHDSGAAGAPMLVAADWTDRLPKGEDTLVDHAINGIGVMPAKGGRSDLSDEQVRASVEYMLAQVQ